jgi:hypothetical protein
VGEVLKNVATFLLCSRLSRQASSFGHLDIDPCLTGSGPAKDLKNIINITSPKTSTSCFIEVLKKAAEPRWRLPFERTMIDGSAGFKELQAGPLPLTRTPFDRGVGMGIVEPNCLDTSLSA